MTKYTYPTEPLPCHKLEPSREWEAVAQWNPDLAGKPWPVLRLDIWAVRDVARMLGGVRS